MAEVSSTIEEVKKMMRKPKPMRMVRDSFWKRCGVLQPARRLLVCADRGAV